MAKHRSFKLKKFIKGVDNDLLKAYFTHHKISVDQGFVFDKDNFGFAHLITAMHIDYEYHMVLNELFPTVYENPKVQKLLVDFKTALE